MEWMIQLLAAFLGTLGYSLLFRVKRGKLFAACCGAVLSWGTYLLVGQVAGTDPLRFLAASVVLTLYSEIMARKMKAPVTVFLIPAAIPLVPGGSLYYTMQAAMLGEWDVFRKRGLDTLQMAAAIAVGMVCVMAVIRASERIRNASLS